MADQFGNLSPEDFAQQQAINRQQRLASMLMQNTAQPQGQMVSGRYVAPSFFQNITPLVNAYFGKELQEKGDTQQTQLATAIRNREDEAMKNLINVSRGTPAQQGGIYGADGKITKETTADMYDANLQLNPQYTEKANIEAKPANQDDVLLAAMKLRDPSIRNMMLTERFKPKSPITVAQGAALIQQNPDNTFTPVYENPKEVTLSAKNKQAAEVLGLPLDSSKWSQEDRNAIQTFVTMSDKSNRPITSVSVPVSVTTQKAYGQEFGGLIAKQDMEKYTVAQSAPKMLLQSTQIKDLVGKGAFTGIGSDFALSAAKVFNVGGANNAEKIKNTELLVSSLGQNVLNNVKTSGLGAGQGFTEKDLKFLERVVGGQIALDKNTIVELANLQEKVAKASMAQWNDRFKTMPKEVIQATGIGPVYIPMNANPNTVFSAADAIIQGK